MCNVHVPPAQHGAVPVRECHIEAIPQVSCARHSVAWRQILPLNASAITCLRERQ